MGWLLVELLKVPVFHEGVCVCMCVCVGGCVRWSPHGALTFAEVDSEQSCACLNMQKECLFA